MPRRIIEADIKFVSLCPAGMNGIQTLYKSADKRAEFRGVTKASTEFDEKGEIHACVWAPNRIDREGDWADTSTVEKMAHAFARNGLSIDMVHNEVALSKDDVFVAENFIIQKGDPRFEGMKDHEGKDIGDLTGGWGIVLKVLNEDLKKAYREGAWNGVSMAGPAVVADEAPPIDDRLVAAMKSALGIRDTENQEVDVTKEEMEALLKAQTDSLKDLIKTEVATAVEEKVGKSEEDQPKDEPKDEVDLDLTDADAVEKRIAALKMAKVDKNDPEALQKHLDSLKGEGDGKEEEKVEKNGKPAHSNTPPGSEEQLTKAQERMKLGRRIARLNAGKEV